MKKIYVILIFFVLLFTPVLSACDNNKNTKWLELSTKTNEFLNNTEYSDLLNGSVFYTSKIDSAKAMNTSNFYVLQKYESLLEYCFVNLKLYKDVFASAPIFNKASGNALCNKAISKIEKFENEVLNFRSEKTLFENNINFTSSTESSSALEYLKIFEKHFAELIRVASEMQEAFSLAFSKLYADGVTRIPDPTTTNVAQSLVLVYSDLIKAYVDFQTSEGDEVFLFSYQNYLNQLSVLESKIFAGNFTKTNYAQWIEYYDAFLLDYGMFNECLDKIWYYKVDALSSTEDKIYKNKLEYFMTVSGFDFISVSNNLLFS